MQVGEVIADIVQEGSFISMQLVRAVLPVNLSQNRIHLEAAGGTSVSVSKFSTATLSNVPRGSGLFW